MGKAKRAALYAILPAQDTPAEFLSCKLPTRFWQYLTPLECISVVWLAITFPLCFVKISELWLPILWRIFAIPTYLLLRPAWILWKKPKYAPRVAILHGIVTFFVLFSTLLMYPVGYWELGKFIAVLWKLNSTNECTRDVAVMKLEEKWFHGEPALWMHTKMGTGVAARILAEYLQLCYFSLFLIVTVVPLVLYLSFRGRDVNGDRGSLNPVAGLWGGACAYARLADGLDESMLDSANPDDSDPEPRHKTRIPIQWYNGSYDPEMELSIMCVLVTSFTCWIVYLCYPVAGPLWCLPPRPRWQQVGYIMAKINLGLQAGGASHGTATPSSHCAGSVSVWLVALVFHKRLAAVGVFFVPSLCMATVYLHYHYAVDSIFGTLWGLVVPLIAAQLSSLIRSRLRLKAFAAALPNHPAHRFQGYGGYGGSEP